MMCLYNTLYSKAKNCQLHLSTVSFLGYVLFRESICIEQCTFVYIALDGITTKKNELWTKLSN